MIKANNDNNFLIGSMSISYSKNRQAFLTFPHTSMDLLLQISLYFKSNVFIWAKISTKVTVNICNKVNAFL